MDFVNRCNYFTVPSVMVNKLYCVKEYIGKYIFDIFENFSHLLQELFPVYQNSVNCSRKLSVNKHEQNNFQCGGMKGIFATPELPFTLTKNSVTGTFTLESSN